MRLTPSNSAPKSPRSGIGESPSPQTTTTKEPGDERQSVLGEESGPRQLDIPPPLSLTPCRPPARSEEIVRVPSGWDRQWTATILGRKTRNSFLVEAPETLKVMARRILALTNKHMWNVDCQKVNDLRWTYKLLELNSGETPATLPLSIELLVDDDKRRLSDSRQASTHRTMALMIAAWDVLRSLYVELCARAGEPDPENSRPHLEWRQLPVRALVVGCLTLEMEEFLQLLTRIFESLKFFEKEVKAQVYADLCALSLGNPVEFETYKDILSGELLGPASGAHLKDIENLKLISQAYVLRTAVNSADFIILAETLPPREEPWSLFAVIAIEHLSKLYQLNLLEPDEASKLLSKATEFIRYFMSLISPGQFQLLQSAVGYLSNKLAAAAFMELSAAEKIRFLQCYSPDADWQFIKMVVDQEELSTNEKLRLIDEILRQEPKLMDKVLGVLLNRRGLFQGPLPGPL